MAPPPRSGVLRSRHPGSRVQLGALITDPRPICLGLTVEDLSPRGYGLGRLSAPLSLSPRLQLDAGDLIEIPGAIPGEVVDVEVYEAGRGGLGRVLHRRVSSPDRRDPRCPLSEGCPGCTARHLTAEAAFEAKRRPAASRLASKAAPWASPTPLQPIDDLGYRSRAVARALRGPEGEIILGMVGHPWAPPVPLAQCPAHTQACRDLLTYAGAELRRLGLTAYDPRLDEGLVKAVHAHSTDHGPGRLIFALARSPRADEPVSDLGATLTPGAGPGIYVDVLPRRGGGLIRKPAHLRGSDRLQVTGPRGLILDAAPLAWTPQSPRSGPALLDTLEQALELASTDRVLEIGCGVGTHGLALAHRCQRWLGVDHTRAAIQSGALNAERSGLANLQLRVGDGAKTVRRLLAAGERFEAVILHGMRAPFGPELMQPLQALGASRLIYVTPTPGALARDLAHLHRWRPGALWALDQMPSTAHLMVIAQVFLT